MQPVFPGTLDLHRRAVAHLSQLEPAVRVFGEQPPAGEPRDCGYVIVDGDPGYAMYYRACGGQSEHAYRVALRVCGFSVAQVLNTLDLVRDRLRGWRPLSGRQWTDAAEEDAGPVLQDDSDPTDVRYVISLTYRVEG